MTNITKVPREPLQPKSRGGGAKKHAALLGYCYLLFTALLIDSAASMTAAAAAYATTTPTTVVVSASNNTTTTTTGDTVTTTTTTPCTSDFDCSLNGVCSSGECVCDAPWGGTGCGVLQYKKNQSVVSRNVYPLNATNYPTTGPCVTKNTTCDALNTWNGPIVGPVNGQYHFFNPLYKKGSLLSTQKLMHGVSSSVEGPYTWTSMPDIGSNPAAVTFTDPATGKLTYTLWAGGKVYSADMVDGPYSSVGVGPGGNPAPVFHKGAWYATSQRTSSVLMAAKLGDAWTHYADIVPRLDSGTQEDPFMWIDTRGNWHIINHAYDTSQWQHCGESTLSAHLFSGDDGKTWHILKPNVEPYTHTVAYADGVTHTYNTLERPNLHFNEKGELTHINLAADLVSQDAGCPYYDICPAKREHCACTNCKYADHAGTIVIALDV